MKKYIKLLGLGATIVAMAGLTACHDEQTLLGGEGTVMIRASVNTDVRVNSRATAEELGEQCLIHIYNNKGLVRRFNGINSVPVEGIKLKADSYVAEAWTGDSVSASFDDRWFKGREEFVVTNAQTTQVNLVCKIANVVAAVEYADNLDEVMKDYTMTVGHSRGTLDFVGREDRWGYFMMPNADTDLTWTLNATMANGESFTRTGTIANVNPATLYTLKVSYSDQEGPQIGGGYITIVIDETALEINDNVMIAMAPLFTGIGFDIDKPLVAEAGKIGRQEVVVGATSALTSFVLASDAVAARAGVNGANDFDLFNATDEVRETLRNAGIEWIYTYDEENDVSNLNLIMADDLLNSLGEGTHHFDLTATDANNKTTRRTMTVIVTNADVMANAANPADVWATKATITGDILKDTATNPGFMYRAVGTQSWSTVAGAVSGTTYSAELTGLEPGTTYEYIAVADGYEGSDVLKFTTETAAQMPNSGFEQWNESGKAHLVCTDEASMFWDSGNHGSATMNKNITTRSTAKVHEGSSSACLASQFVGVMGIGKFAAGNVFVGKYLGTDGTNGILGWGRAWNSRPTSLSGWIHYTPQTVTEAATNPGGVAKGDMDRGIIYIALLDDTEARHKDDQGYDYPVVVRTKEKRFFSKDDANVIAYGEMIFNEATAGDDLVPFTVNLTYKRTDVKPSYIMVVASASQYGDYFTGGPSVMYLDDLKLGY